MYLLGSGWASENLRPKPGTALKVLGVLGPKSLAPLSPLLRSLGEDSYEAWAWSRYFIYPVPNTSP